MAATTATAEIPTPDAQAYVAAEFAAGLAATTAPDSLRHAAWVESYRARLPAALRQ